MQYEGQFITHLIKTKDIKVLDEYKLEVKHFRTYPHIVDWVIEYNDRYGSVPSMTTITEEFVEFEEVLDLDAPGFIAEKILENCVFQDLREILINGGEMAGENPQQAIYSIQSELDDLTKEYSDAGNVYDWVVEAKSRYEEYMETHGQDGLAGMPYGIETIDEATGGICEKDFVVLTARLGEGKSLLVSYIAYSVWLDSLAKQRDAREEGIELEPQPVLIITTEMPTYEVAYRLDTMRGHFSNRALNEGRLDNVEDYKLYTEELSKKENSIIIVSEEDNNGRQFTPRDIQRLVDELNPRLVLIDQLYDIDDGTNEKDIRKNIVNVSKQLRSINLNTKTPIVLVTQSGRGAAQTARTTKGATPEPDQIQESDAPGQRATVILSIKLMENEILKISIKKSRGGSRDIDAYLKADIDRGYYGEIDEVATNF